MRITSSTLLFASLCSFLTGCGGNLFSSTEAKDPAEDAAIALEKGDENKAISILEDALQGDPGNSRYLSILSSAYAQRAGVEPLTIAQGMASKQSGEGDAQSQSGLVELFGIMPPATIRSLEDIDYSMSLLAQIDADARTNGDLFKIAIYQTCSMVMHMKILDTDGDGQLSLEEITNLSDLSAGGLLSQLAGAQAILASQGADSETMAKVAESLTQYQTQIDAAPGATQEEKLRNYMAQSQTTTP